MTYLVLNLASYLFFAQLLGLLLGWLLWGYSAAQRKKEIALLQKRMTEVSLHPLKPLDEAAPRIGLPGVSVPAGRDGKTLETLLAGGPESLLADLPPLAPLPPDPDEEDAVHEALKAKDALVADLKRQVDALKTQLATLGSRKDAEATDLKSQLQSLHQQLSAAKMQANPAQEALRDEIEKLKAQLARADQQQEASAALGRQLHSLKAERDSMAGELKDLRAELEKRGDLERKLALLTSEASFTAAEKERAAGELRTARADFEKRSSWLTKRIHELERSAEEWEKAKSDLTLSARAEAAKSRSHDGGELVELKQRLEHALQERDAMAAEIAGHRNGTGQISPEVAELQQSLVSRDSQLMEQVARGERLLWRVTELESFANRVPELETALSAKDAQIVELTGEGAERDSHIRTLLRRMTELEPLSQQVAELKAQLQGRETELEQHKLAQARELDEARARMQEVEAALREKDSAHAESRQQLAELASQRTADLEAFSARAASLESELRQKQAALAEVESAHAEKAAMVESLQAQVRELAPLPEQLQDLTEKHQSDLTRLKVSSAQRIRKLRQGITSFKG
jgi:chromosome segregation ATPase